METAYLRIKFTPLLQNIHKSHSKCYVEIVPEVSCIQNLHKIEWKKEQNIIEYSIPMTYKIILKKRQNLDENNSDLDKTYHSCVDLLIPSSLTRLSLGSGDIFRKLSDTFILSDVSANIGYNTNRNNLQNSNAENNEQVTNENYEHTNHLTGTTTNIIKETSKDTEATSENEVIIHEDNQETNGSSSDNKSDKSAISIPLNNNTKTQSVETITYVSTARYTSKQDSKRILSLTPICSINTDEDPVAEINDLRSNSVLCRIIDHQNDSLHNEHLEISNIYHANVTEYQNNWPSIKRPAYKRRKRESAEVRVAKFVKKMELEILPLKLMLNDILRKCIPLDLSVFGTKETPQKYLMYNYNCNQISKFCTENDVKSNRVVYSIVFDG